MYRALVFAAIFITGNAMPQGVTSAIPPTGVAPSGCMPTFDGEFAVSMIPLPSETAPANTAAVKVNQEETKESSSSTPNGLPTLGSIVESPGSEPIVANTLKTRTPGDLKKSDNISAPVTPANCVNKTSGALIVTLDNSIMHDALGRTAYIADNYQWQFDKPPQAGAITTAGYSVCRNNSVALGSSAIWWQCNSGPFDNIYDRNWAYQCKPAVMTVIPVC